MSTKEVPAEALVIPNYRAEIPADAISSGTEVLIVVEGPAKDALASLTRKYLAHQIVARVDDREIFRGTLHTAIESGRLHLSAPRPQPEFAKAVRELVRGQGKLELSFE